MNPHRLLITGGAGFIGSNFVHYWIKNNPTSYVIVLDALTYAGNRTNLAELESKGSIRFVHGDIRDQRKVEALLREGKIDTIVHFAAESHVDRSILGPDPFLETNVMGTHVLLKAAKNIWLDPQYAPEEHRFHHISTDEVYGSLAAGDPAFTEDTPYRPNSPYAASKAASDHIVRAYHHTYGLDITISNCSNNYGPYHFPEKLIPLMIINLLNGRELPIYGDGRNVRDWLHVEDHCQAIERILRSGVSGETYNIGGNSEYSNLDMVNMLCSEMDARFKRNEDLRKRFVLAPAARGEKSSSLIRFVKDRPGHDFRYAIDASKIRNLLGFIPGHTINEGIGQTMDWFLDNESWWKHLVESSPSGMDITIQT